MALIIHTFISLVLSKQECCGDSDLLRLEKPL